MPITTNVQQVKVNIMTEAQYEDITPNSDEFYAVTDAQLSYNDLTNKPTIPTVNNPTITITQGGVSKGSFTLNQASDDTIALDAGGGGNYCSFPDYSTTPETFTKAGGDVTGYYTLDKNYWMFSGGSIRIGTNTGRQITSGGAMCCVPVPSGTTIYVSGTNAYGYPMT